MHRLSIRIPPINHNPPRLPHPIITPLHLMHQQTRQRQPRQNPHPPKPRNRTKLAVLVPADVHFVLQRVDGVLVPAIRRREPQLARDQVLEQVALHDGHGGVRVEGVVLAERGDVAEGVDARAGLVDAARRAVGSDVAGGVAQGGRREGRVGRDARAGDVGVDDERGFVVELDFDLAG